MLKLGETAIGSIFVEKQLLKKSISGVPSLNPNKCMKMSSGFKCLLCYLTVCRVTNLFIFCWRCQRWLCNLAGMGEFSANCHQESITVPIFIEKV